MRPGGGVFDYKNETIVKWLGLADAWTFSFIGLIRSGSLVSARCGGHPVGGGFVNKPHYFDPEQLYDREADPFERRNLVHEPAYSEILAAS